MIKYISAIFMISFIITSCTNKIDHQMNTENSDRLEITTGSFTAKYPAAAIKLLKDKINQTRYPDELSASNGQYGYPLGKLKTLLDYWANEFDFDQHLQRINTYQQYVKEANGFKIHFVHEKSGEDNAIPLVLLHGWPSTYLQMNKIIPLLTSKIGDVSFDVIVFSLPGYGFSDIPSQSGMAVHKMAEILHQLMVKELGYEQFVLRASDIGAGVAKEWALAYPQNILGLHLSGSSPYIYYVPENISEAEQEFVKNANGFMQRNGAYAALHSTEPQTLAYALNDSPAGLAAWILQRYEGWTDHDGNLESIYTKDDLLDLLTVYWMTGTINSSMRSYFESANVYSPNAGKQVEVPTAFLMLKKDIATAPQEWEARTYAKIVSWKENESGGHFGEWEKPQLVAEDLRAFVEKLKE